MARKYPAIPEPSADPKVLYETVLALKQMVEILTGQRRDQRLKSVPTWEELVTLEVIAEDQVPR